MDSETVEKLGKRVCLDTDVIIDFLKGHESSAFKYVFQSQTVQVFVSAVTAYELQMRKDNLDTAERFLKKVPVFPFDEITASIAAAITMDLKGKGTLIDSRDVFIAATAKQWNASILTRNHSHFQRINGLQFYSHK
ncbi:MAG: type II toxin-antitoxin system VapC family toxin [Candidatus Diapherotrites archaeon]|nr:type II toxin-antitoxin system VapC family toxin [Candidatus Diapherotrites archaeon]